MSKFKHKFVMKKFYSPLFDFNHSTNIISCIFYNFAYRIRPNHKGDMKQTFFLIV